ncbi:O-antigen polymerase [Niallia hominis]|uniref:O-antigen polymerase n=1 Tax=Niallia hominis TaxID=3133173 RepID=A0ABV1EYH8_9BACI
MALLLILAFFLISTITCFLLYRNIINPPVILSFVWFIVFLFYTFSPFADFNFSHYYLIFVFGHFLFIVGFMLISKPLRKNKVIGIKKNNVNYYININSFKIIILIEFVILLLALFNIRKILSTNFINNWWFSLKYAKNMQYYDNGILFGYAVIFSFVLTYILFALYLNKKNTTDIELKKILYIQFVIAGIYAILSLGRTFIFLLFIPLFFIYIIYKSKNTFQTIRVMVIFFGGLLLIFFIINSLKNVQATSGMMDSFYLYVSGSIKAFIIWADFEENYMNGANTFRFVFSVLNSIGFDMESGKLIEDFIWLDSSHTTNVYTIYKWYYSDFGLFYALLIQFLLGMFHGLLYNNLFKKGTLTAVVLLSISFYPLIMQFFQDQYVALTSTWIQVLFWISLIFKSGFFIVKKKK